ncbi:cellulase [Mycena vulgaris]|nr:cellulase [Mycena vulgaris]
MLLSLGAIALWLCLTTTVVSAARRNVPTWTPPLSTRGRYVVDANGDRFKLKGGNWHGASGTWTSSGDINDDANHHANENALTMPLGLQYFSNQMLHDNTPIQDSWVAANPQFKGLTPLQVYDAVIKALTDRGFAVIVNNHTNTSIWCCGIDGNERWNESQNFDMWANDWLMVVTRYKNNKRVVGADLYNEVRRDILTDPDRGSGDGADWENASQLVADRIFSEANPDILVIVEGINWIGLPVGGLPHSRPTLTSVQQLSHTLLVSHKLVYAAHFYGYTGPNHSGATGIGETSDPRYRDLSRADLFAILNSEALYVALTDQMHYTAPVWVSEFGVAGRGNTGAEVTWFQNFVDYVVQTDADFAFWPLVGYLTNGSGNGWALMNWEAAAAGNARGCSTGTTGARLTLEHGDFVQSLAVRTSIGDFDSGASKGVCPDNLRLIGLSHGVTRALCGGYSYGSLWASARAVEVVFDERHVVQDWASGYTKYQCPIGYFVSGYALRGVKLSTVLCAQASQMLGTSGRTVWFDQGDNRADTLGGDFAPGQFKGSCAGDEYVGGIAFTTRLFNNGAPAALLCVV